MNEPYISERALTDLDDIWLYIARDSIVAADRVIEEIYAAAHRLAEMPEMGHVREDVADPSLKFWNLHSYLVVYRPDTRPVEIVRILSGYRDIGGLL
jgi:plasmid stabilization system protein ParE